VRTAHEIEEVGTPLVSPIKMTATGIAPLTGRTSTRGTGVRTVAATPPHPKIGLPAIAGLFLLTVIALLLGVMLFGRATPPAVRPPVPARTAPVHTVEPMPAPPPAPAATVTPASPPAKEETAPRRRAHNHRRPSKAAPEHLPNPFE
jgi:hypothetical protein